VAPRDQKYQSNFVEFKRSTKIVYRRYAGLFFCVCVDANDNELAYLEAIHFFVEVLDQFFGNVCELDLVFNFYKVRLKSKHPVLQPRVRFMARRLLDMP
jgi:AP-2 complex subunit sigma-1